MTRRILLSLVTAALLTAEAAAQRVAPPPPANYDVQVRYRIRVGRNERIVQFRDMVRYFESIGFQRVESEDPNEPADPNAERMSGTLPSNRVNDLLREPHVHSVLLVPAGYKLPDNADQRVLVQIKLAGGLGTTRQRELFLQTLDKLVRLGLVEKVGYDHEGFSRILGTLPAGQVDLLVRDLRVQPAGWLTPQTPVDDLPDPIRAVEPIRVAEVLSEPAGVPPSGDVLPPPAPPAGQEFLAKIAPDLRAAAAGDSGAAAIRFEVVLTRVPTAEEIAWRSPLLAQSGLAVEGRMGPVVSVLAPPASIQRLAALPEVATVRPPRMATLKPVQSPAAPIPGPELLHATGLDRLHALKHRGAGVRVSVIDADFTGAAAQFPHTPVLDLTAARNYTLLPEPAPEAVAGRGTRLAAGVKLAAPEAELVLIRVDPAAMYQLLTIARYIRGEAFRPESLVDRNRELLADNDVLRVQRARLTEERMAMANEFSQEEDVIKRRQALEARTAELARQEQQYHERLARFFALESGLIDLRAVNLVVCPLAWDEGYPVDGSGPLSRYLDDVYYGRPRVKVPSLLHAPKTTALWFQAAGNTRGQAWGWLLNDVDANGVLEFAPPSVPIPEGRWTSEVNFLAWQPASGERTFDLPAGGRVRLVFQWTEAHDPAVSDLPGPDLYHVPLADLRLLVLRQRDPSGKTVGSDDFNVIARSDPLPQLIERRPNWATYEHVVEFAPAAAGRFALRIEGVVPPTTRPATVPTLPALERFWEAHGRLFVSTAGANGRVVIGDYQPGRGGLGAPGNALYPRAIGAINAAGRPQPYSAAGPPSGQEVLIKPRFLTFDDLTLPGVPSGAGTEQATAFAAGMYASMMSAGTIEAQKLSWLAIPPAGVLRVPPAWLDQVERRWPKTGRE